MLDKKIYLGADHAGYELKEKIKQWLDLHNIPYDDLGNHILDPNDDFPDFAYRVAKTVKLKKSFGILLCGSAQGVCISANKVKGIRAVIPFSLKEARLSREHVNANIICLSGWFMRYHKATKLLETFLTTPFSKAPRHLRRLNKIRRIELSR